MNSQLQMKKGKENPLVQDQKNRFQQPPQKPLANKKINQNVIKDPNMLNVKPINNVKSNINVPGQLVKLQASNTGAKQNKVNVNSIQSSGSQNVKSWSLVNFDIGR